ncbi:hypothetical protein D3C87_1817920 [compost metagenome]
MQHLQAIQAGQGEVQDDRIGLASSPLAERCAAVPDGGHFHATARQGAVQRGLHGGVVFDKKQLHARDHITVSECRSYGCFP